MRLMTTILLAFAPPFSAALADELATKPSKYPVKDTVDRLTSALKSRYKIEGRDDILKTLTGALEAFTGAASN